MPNGTEEGTKEEERGEEGNGKAAAKPNEKAAEAQDEGPPKVTHQFLIAASCGVGICCRR